MLLKEVDTRLFHWAVQYAKHCTSSCPVRLLFHQAQLRRTLLSRSVGMRIATPAQRNCSCSLERLAHPTVTVAQTIPSCRTRKVCFACSRLSARCEGGCWAVFLRTGLNNGTQPWC